MNYFKYVIMKHFCCLRHFVEQLIYEKMFTLVVHICMNMKDSVHAVRDMAIFLNASWITANFSFGLCNLPVQPPSNTCCVFIMSEFVSLSHCFHILHYVGFEYTWSTAHKLSNTLYSVLVEGVVWIEFGS